MADPRDRTSFSSFEMQLGKKTSYFRAVPGCSGPVLFRPRRKKASGNRGLPEAGSSRDRRAGRPDRSPPTNADPPLTAIDAHLEHVHRIAPLASDRKALYGGIEERFALPKCIDATLREMN